VTSTVVIGGYRTLPECLMTITRRANSAKVMRSRTPAKLYVYEAILRRLTQHFQDVAAELWQFIQQENPLVRQRHVARQRHLATPDQPHIGDRVVRGATRPRGDHGGALAGEAGDAVEAGGLEGFGEAHRGQDGGEPARQPRRPHPRWTEEEDMMVTTPA
jgi:hypothetical protein